MKEALENLLRKVVLPINDRLVDVKVSKKSKNNFYIITYYINDRIDYHDAFIIERETNTLFNMLSPAKGESFMIQYRSVAED